MSLSDYVTIALAVIGAAAAIAAVTPTPVDDGIVRLLRKVLDIIAMNVGKARNKED